MRTRQRDESVAIAVSGSLVLDDEDLVIQAALDGAGPALVADNRVTPHFADRTLIRLMEDCTPPFPASFFTIPIGNSSPLP